ncbi:putative MFS-type transporter [Tolypocladium ophioglossoides CBS 100239]|uniref:Putative MFS-type transporter n=1 Tax=Tolypocladium ophioglossoides (strain CBS 100239) TaxID=1163406 RepID=A0A0L0NEV3_TOLOC|nr:putative MFS-type transporter [Tolypocladium ophioglossoides CBS 100239]
MDQSTDSTHDRDRGSSFWAPGTLALEDLHLSSDQVILHPVPTSDPNDPLNWTTWRKTLNFGLVSCYVLLTFVQLDIGFTAWEAYQTELGFGINLLNASVAASYGGLAIGCIFFIPLVHKFGRRPLYLFSTALQLGSCVWFAVTKTPVDLIGSNLVSGLGGAISETIVQITIADLFFVHHHAAMNGWYLLASFGGAYLGPVAAGYIVNSQGWRWIWWWCVILFSVNLVLVIFFFEESKYVPVIQGRNETQSDDPGQAGEVRGGNATDGKTLQQLANDVKQAESGDPLARTHSNFQIDHTISMKSYRERLALITRSDGSILHNFYQPAMVLFTFPAVAYTAITYGSLLAWFAILTSVQATYLFSPPYNFTAAGVGLMNIAPFIGTIPAIFVGGYLNDKSIVWLSRRNGGVYEPEMRLWLALPAAIITPASILMFGLGLYYEAPWPLLATGFGIFGFGLILAGDVALSYAMDCYHDIVGNSLVGVIFTRNALSVVVLFALTPWIESMGLLNLHVIVAVLCFVILLIPVPLLIWGKKARIASAKSYLAMARQQPTHREV